MSSPKILVTGASGHLGRRVVEILLQSGGAHIIAASRDIQKLADLSAKGAELRMADFEDAQSLQQAFEGVDRVLVISTDALDKPGRRLAQHKNAVKAAKEAGVKHIAYTSMLNPEEGSPVPFAPDHLGTEQAIKASGIPYTILRNAWYMENLFMSLPQNLAMEQWYTSAADGKINYVSRDDCARMAAAVLLKPSANVTFNVTGPETHSIEEIATIAGEIAGKPIAVIQITDEQLAAGLKSAGLPDAFVPILVSFDVNTRKGLANIVTSAIADITGKAPVTLKTFLTTHKAQWGA